MQCESCGHQNLEGARFCASCGALLPSEQKGPDPMIGQLVGGRFRVTGVLGEGGMGVVYVGEQQMGSTVRKVAIKTLHQHLSKDPSVLARFHRECGTVAQLEHPNTIKVYDFGSTADGTLYIAMEFVAGKPLADVIRDEGAISPDRVIKIMRQVCGALDEAHDKGIIHRDLKPENVILTNRAGETDFVKVLDFGIAARSESADASKEQKLTQQGMVLGTPPYMSPEQFTGKALDVRSDVYSLGVMAYEMLTSRLPFEADTPWQWATQHMTAQPIPFETAAPARSIPPGLRSAILRALSKDRDQRQATARDFYGELSGGGRMTVDAPPPQMGSASSGTAAMDVVPDFNSPVPMTPANYGPTIGGPPAAMPIPARVQIPAGPSATRPAKGGGKGLIVGLGAAGVVLLIAMAVVAARSLKDDDDVTENPPANPTTPNTVATIKPTETSGALGAAGAAVIAPDVVPPTQSTEATPPEPTRPVSSKPPSGAAGASGTSSGTGTRPPAGGGGCDQCAAMANGGNILGAASAANSCSDAAKKQDCMNKIRGKAPNAATNEARLGRCSDAKAIIAAAQRLGLSSPRLDNALDNTSCK